MAQNTAYWLQVAPVGAADNASLVSHVAALVNEAYSKTEKGIFGAGYRRTDDDDIATYMRQGQLVTASDSANAVVGCVVVKQLSQRLGDMGPLALESTLHGTGLGRGLVQFAEQHCRQLGCTAMQLELVVPKSFHHDFKARLQSWYLRMGYRVVRLGSFHDEYPHLEALLTGPIDYKIFEKSL
ncbi:hypothetical protein CDD81_2611 [Ophiocordyceps australis]|uniref:N-acetyltransferase domain-containing protein n=1 Tax=Ophiocordyceps australis TaxID=1399860 RepID=A0A2C5XWH7_9HYPO|nr:hypothetical protein CDD81_2611 [Ophiocordyceps australis]